MEVTWNEEKLRNSVKWANEKRYILLNLFYLAFCPLNISFFRRSPIFDHSSLEHMLCLSALKNFLFRTWYSLIGNLHFLKEKKGTSRGLMGAPLLNNPNSQIHIARKIFWEMFQITRKHSLLVCQNFQVMILKGK